MRALRSTASRRRKLSSTYCSSSSALWVGFWTYRSVSTLSSVGRMSGPSNHLSPTRLSRLVIIVADAGSHSSVVVAFEPSLDRSSRGDVQLVTLARDIVLNFLRHYRPSG